MILTSPPSPILFGLTGVFCALLVATLVAFIRPRFKPGKDTHEFGVRLRTMWWILSVLASVFLLGTLPAIAFTGFVSFVAFKEYLSLMPARRADHGVRLWAYLAIPVQYYWVAIGSYELFIVFIPVYVLLGLAFRAVLTAETKNFVNALGTLYLGLMLTVYNISHIAYLFVMPLTRPTPAGGAGLCFYLLALTAFNDIFQYVWGKCFGRRKVMPAISPGKTWAGLVGGVATCAAVAVALAPFFTPFDIVHALGMGLMIGVAGFAGDVTMSAVKRDLGIKNTGSMLPGHGGFLDRLDSFMFTAPLFLHLTRFFMTVDGR
jgi:phosphatidate cytidylyltransferase